MKRFLKEVGRFKVLLDRQRQYISIFNFFMLAYLFFDKVGFHWYYLLIVPVWLLFVWFDARMIIPNELNYWHHKSPVFRKLLKRDNHENPELLRD